MISWGFDARSILPGFPMVPPLSPTSPYTRYSILYTPSLPPFFDLPNPLPPDNFPPCSPPKHWLTAPC